MTYHEIGIISAIAVSLAVLLLCYILVQGEYYCYSILATLCDCFVLLLFVSFFASFTYITVVLHDPAIRARPVAAYDCR